MASDTNQSPYLVLGLDPGIASCGFCLLDMTNHKILEMGSHLFNAPQEAKTKVSLATIRRNARSVRRNLDRKRDRRKHCFSLLVENGLAPKGETCGWLQSRKGERPVSKLRNDGLYRKLTGREFAQVLYWLVSHRGYIPHGEGKLGKIMSGEVDVAELGEDSGKVLKAVSANAKEMEAKGCRTVGELAYRQGRSRNRNGDYANCVLNAQIIDEVRKLFKLQRKLGNIAATEGFENDYINVLTWEKETLDHDEKTYQLVGPCTYFPDEKRAANADLSAELCKAYERFGHLAIVEADGTERRLTADERDSYLAVLFSPTPLKNNKDCKVTYKSIRKDLGLSPDDCFKGVPVDDEGKKEPYEPKTWRTMRRLLPATFYARLLGERGLANAVCEALTYASTEKSLMARLDGLPLSDGEIDALLSLPYSGKLFNGYGARSLVALDLLLDSFEEPEILTLTDAERASGLLNLRLDDGGNTRSTLLMPYNMYDGTCKNPVVLRAMARMRKIVNSIIRIHGVPDEIHIELGRELKLSKRERKQIEQNNRTNENANRQWRETIAETLGIDDPNDVSPKLVRKCSMAEEQGWEDPYTGDEIELVELLLNDRYCETDHVLPYSRTCDDSRANKVLVLSASNQNKRERTPYEWMTSGEANAPSWDKYRARVLGNKKYGQRKRGNLLNQKLGEEEQARFIERNLNDTRYMSVAVKNYLEDCLLFPEDGRKRHVTAVAGGATATLRRLWKMNTGSRDTKDRDDPRHHAVDAAIIAACGESTMKKVACARSLGKETFKHVQHDALRDTQPWPTFADDVMECRKTVVPTRSSGYRVKGQATEGTAYRFVGKTDDKSQHNILYANEKDVKKGNIIIDKDGTARIVGGMAFMRLWLDAEARKGKGAWLAEPVYYADLAAIRNGTYVPKACVAGVARTSWAPIPERILQTASLIVYRGDVLDVDGEKARFNGFSISTRSLNLQPLTSTADVTAPTLGKWTKDTRVSVIQEDCLGHCHC